MTYTRGQATAAQNARQTVERERAEVEALYAEGRKLAETSKHLRARNANIEARVAAETERLADKRAALVQALADLEAAQLEAETEIHEAERNAALIRELAYDQARAIAERAYRSGYDRGKDASRAKHAVLSKLVPAHHGAKRAA